MDIFDLYPIDDKNEFLLLNEFQKKLLKKKRKKFLQNENIKFSPPIDTNIENPKNENIDEIINNLEKIKNLDENDIELLRKLILKYLPLCKKEINIFNEILLQLKEFLSVDIEDVLIETNFIDNNTEEIIKKINFLGLKNIVNKLLEILYILVDYYMILNNKLLI
jgi:hypothetical protein